MTPTKTVIEGKYEIQKEIGHGGMSTVYLAMDTHLNKLWAVKEIRKTGRTKSDEVVVNSLLAEANLMKRLDHPTLPRIVDIIDNGKTLYVVMDYIEGESLDKILAEYGAQPEEAVIKWSMQICEALSYLHSQRPPIIYRDMKPANVMLKPDGNIKIIDFGIAREYKEQNMADTKILGTHGYAPPEQYGSWQTDARSDIFALGMTMHHLLTGADPRPESYVYQPVRVYNPELSEGIEYIINKCTEPAAENRYQSCDELMFDLLHPELVTSGYKKSLKKKLFGWLAVLIFSLAAFAGAFVCANVAEKMNTDEYEEAILRTNDLESYIHAKELYPERIEAYEKILDYYEEQISARSDDSAAMLLLNAELNRFETVYNVNDPSFLEADAQSFAQLNYRAGKMCYTYLERSLKGDENFRVRVNRAYTYFNQNHLNIELGTLDDSSGIMQLSECYYTICSFYKTYVFSQTSDAASAEDFNHFLSTLAALAEEIQLNESATSYDKLELYNNIFMMLYNQRTEAVNSGASEASMLELMDTMYEYAQGIDATQRELWKNLKAEITDNYTEYRAAIGRAYDRTEVK